MKKTMTTIEKCNAIQRAFLFGNHSIISNHEMEFVRRMKRLNGADEFAISALETIYRKTEK